MLYIRADGNTEIGMGHVMRCLSVAEAAADTGGQPPVFITAEEGCRPMIEDRGFRVIVLDTDYRDMMGELPQLGKLFGGRVLEGRRDVLLVDSYQAGREYYIALRQFARVACLEDMGLAYPVDLLINYNIYAPGLMENYREPASGGRALDTYPRKVLLGAEYMPLRKAFQEPPDYRVRDKVTDVIITTGGSDPHFAMGTIADALCGDSRIAEQGIHLHLVSGPFNRFAGELRQRYQCGEMQGSAGHQGTQKVKVTIHENVKDMRSLLLEGDVVITAAGSTVYEVSSLGVPMIVFYFAENQRQGARALETRTDIVNAGCFAGHGGEVAHRICGALWRCISDRGYRELLSRQERGLIDGKGAHRIAGQLAGLAQDSSVAGR